MLIVLYSSRNSYLRRCQGHSLWLHCRQKQQVVLVSGSSHSSALCNGNLKQSGKAREETDCLSRLLTINDNTKQLVKLRLNMCKNYLADRRNLWWEQYRGIVTAVWRPYKQSRVRSYSKTELRTRPDGIHRDDAMADNLPIVLVDGYSQRRKSGKNHLEENTKYRMVTITETRFEINISLKHQKRTKSVSYIHMFVYLLKDDGLFIPHRVNGVAWGRLCPKCFPFCVHWEAKHIHLHIGANLFIGQELSWYDLLDIL